MAYKSLAKTFYMDSSSERFAHLEQLAHTRMHSESSFRTDIESDAGEFFLAVPRELSVLNEVILRQERQVSLALSELPLIAQGALIRSLVIDEVVCTNELEGIHSTRRQINDLLEHDLVSSRDIEHKRFRELTRLYLELTGSDRRLPQTPEDIRHIYDRVMQGENLGNDTPDGILFRKDSVEVIGRGSRVLHTGLAPESKIISAVGRMVNLATSADIPETYSAIVSHFLFEYIHPFYDGNGRTGRYLLALYLSRPLSTLTALSLSRTIAENKNPYYRAFKEAEDPLNHGELTSFVLDILGYISTAQSRVLTDLERKRMQFSTLTTTLHELEKELDLKPKESELVFLLAQYALFGAFPDLQLSIASEYLQRGQQMLVRYADRLQALNLVETVSKRPRRIMLTEYACALLHIDGSCEAL